MSNDNVPDVSSKGGGKEKREELEVSLVGSTKKASSLDVSLYMYHAKYAERQIAKSSVRHTRYL